MKLVCFKTCPYAHKALTLIKMKDIDCQIEFIEKENKPDWFLKLSPEGKVPLLVLDESKGKVVFESDAILEYLEEAFDHKVMQGDAFDRARARALNYLVSSFFSVFFKIFEATNEEKLTNTLQSLIDNLAKIEPMLNENTKFSAGDSLSFSDIALFVVLVRVNILEEKFGCKITKDLPKVNKLKQNLLATNLVETLVEDFEELFVAKYKKDNSYIINQAK